jgi:hypothetical protein
MSAISPLDTEVGWKVIWCGTRYRRTWSTRKPSRNVGRRRGFSCDGSGSGGFEVVDQVSFTHTVYLPQVSLSWFEVSSDIDMAAKSNRKQNRSEIDLRERSKYPSLMVGSTMKAQSYLCIPKSSGIYKTELRYEDPSPGRVTREA